MNVYALQNFIALQSTLTNYLLPRLGYLISVLQYSGYDYDSGNGIDYAHLFHMYHTSGGMNIDCWFLT